MRTEKISNMKKLTFQEKVYKIVQGIPSGKTLTYKEVAKLAGRAKAYRAVGNILNKNHDPEIPCHRVIRSDGRIGGYNRGSKIKEDLLRKEELLRKEKRGEKFVKS